MLAPWRSQLEQVWAPTIDPKVGKEAKISQNRSFLKKVKNRVFHAEIANFSLSEDPDTHFMRKDYHFKWSKMTFSFIKLSFVHVSTFSFLVPGSVLMVYMVMSYFSPF